MKYIVHAATFLAVGTGAATASAHGITWLPNSAQYDSGNAPSIAIGPYVYMSDVPPGEIMEAHQGNSSDLWDHDSSSQYYFNSSGSTAIVNFTAGTHYTQGFNPTVAGDGATNQFVEIHQGGAGPSAPPLWYSLGTGNARWSFVGEVGQSGFFPTIAITPHQATPGIQFLGLIVDVHQEQEAPGPLSLDVGYPISDHNTNDWTGVSNWVAGQYDSGAFPSVGIARLDDSHYFVLEVHQAGAGFGPLWSDAGILSVSWGAGWQINWISRSQFTSGQYPSVAVCQSAAEQVAGNYTLTVVQANQGNNDSSLWSHFGVLNVNNSNFAASSFSWDGSATHYTNGFLPRVGCGAGIGVSAGMEVHQGTSASGGPLWYRAFTAN